MYIHTIDHVGLIHSSERKVLFIKPKTGNEWSLPGGKIKEGEAYVSALKRIMKSQITSEMILNSIKYYKTFVGQSYGTDGGIKIKMTCFFADFKNDPKPLDKKAEITNLSYEDKGQTNMISRMVFDDLRSQGIIS